MQAHPHIIGHILDSARALHGVLRSEPQLVALGPLLEHALVLARRALGSSPPSMELELDPDAGPVEVEAARLERAISHLVVNAAKHTPAGEPVRIVVHASAAGAEIRISRAGGGLRPQAFSAPPGEAGDGTPELALQLALARQLVQLQGGSIVLRATRAAAPSAVLRLPGRAVRRPVRGAPAYRAGFAPSARLDGVHVLLVEDDLDALDFLALILRQAGATVACHGLAASAFDYFVAAERAPDIVVSDIAMPTEDGYSFLSRLRTWENRHGRIPVPAVAVTAFSRDEDVRRAQAHGFDRHVPKPVEASALVELIASLTRP